MAEHANESRRSPQPSQPSRAARAAARARRRRRRRLFAAAVLAVVTALIAIILVALIRWQYNARVYKQVTVEAGDLEITPELFAKEGYTAAFQRGFTPDRVDTHVPGDYSVKVKSSWFSYECTLTVVDTVPPAAEAAPRSVSPGQVPQAKDLVKDLQDETEVVAAFLTPPDCSQNGDIDVTVLLTDRGGNETRVASRISVIPLKADLEWEAGTAPPTLEDFLLPETSRRQVKLHTQFLPAGEKADPEHPEQVSVEEPGEYPVTFTVGDRECVCRIHVIDTTPPVLRVNDLARAVGWQPRAEEFVGEVRDQTPVTFTFAEQPDTSAEGTVTVIVVAEDAWGNRTEAAATLVIARDTTPPQIWGVKELYARQGGTVKYLTDVTVADDLDPGVKVTVTADSVDLRQEGDYPVTYWAVDGSGNRTEIATVVHVRADVIDEELVAELAQKVAEEIFTEDMTPMEKLETIYHWMHRHVVYRNALCPTEPLPAAYHGLNDRWGDCQVFQYTTKALLDAAGIKNALIDTLPYYDLHCWNLVDIGEGWRHFDTTAFYDGQNFCYVDTATLTARSKAYARSHRFDASRYPDVT